MRLHSNFANSIYDRIEKQSAAPELRTKLGWERRSGHMVFISIKVPEEILAQNVEYKYVPAWVLVLSSVTPLKLNLKMERETRIELAWPAWKAGALPLSYSRY